MNLGVVEQLRHNYLKAAFYFKILIELNSSNPEGYYALAKMYSDNNQNQLAYKNGILAERFYKETNSPYIGDCYYLLCVITINLNNKLEAKKYSQLAKSRGIKIPKQIDDILE